jgi:hypothetical protein
VLLIAGLSRRAALRVDREGITLGSPPRVFLWPGRSVLVRWRDIRAIAVFHQYARWPAPMPVVGLELLGYGEEVELENRSGVPVTLSRHVGRGSEREDPA